MKIEAGKFYRTRDGRKVGPMRRVYDGWIGAERIIESDGFDWYGRGNYSLVDRDNPNDLVSEWADSPIRTVTRVEIVPGTYGSVTIYDDHSATVDCLDANIARAAAKLFNELADVLDENAKEAA